MIALKLSQMGNSVGTILPKEVLHKLKVGKGDTLFLTESEGGYRITPYNPDFEAQMHAARGVMKKRRNVLRQLAK